MEALLGNPKVMKHEKEGKLEHMYAVCAVQGKCNMFALKWDDSVKWHQYDSEVNNFLKGVIEQEDP